MTNTCDATARDNTPCGLPAGWGTNHVGEGRCKLHGGASPHVEDAIERRLLEATSLGSKALVTILGRWAEKARDPESEVDARELDRLLRTAADRVGYGPQEEHDVELTGEGGGPVKLFEISDDWPDAEDTDD